VTWIDLDTLELGVFTPRMGFDEKWVKELAEDIRRHGQHKPIICRESDKRGTYQVVDGEHRARAIRTLNLKTVRAEVRSLTDEEATFLAMRINELHGKPLSDFERGKQMFQLQKRYGWSQEKLGEMFGRSQPWVSDRINIYLKASTPLRNNIITRVIDVSKAREVAKLSENEQTNVVEKIIDEGLSTKETKLLTHVLLEANKEKRSEILEKPIKAIAETYTEPEAFQEAVKTPMEKPLIQWFDCPGCGRRFMVDWSEREVKW